MPSSKVLDDQVLTDIGRVHGKTAGQVVLRWHVQLGTVVFPKAATPKHMQDNFEILDFSLSGDEMSAIKGLDCGERIGPDPATYVFPRHYRGRAATQADA